MSDDRRRALYEQLHTLSRETVDSLIEKGVIR